jgi:integrase
MSSDVTPTQQKQRTTPGESRPCRSHQRRQKHAEKVRQIHGRLARLKRQTPPSRVPDQNRSAHPPGGDASRGKPLEANGSVARAVAEFQQAHTAGKRKNPNTAAALNSVAAAIGGKPTAEITHADISQVVAEWSEFTQHTRSNYTKALKRFLRWLEETEDTTPKRISRCVPRINQPAARAVVASDGERSRLIAAAAPHLRFFLLLCADLGIRHRTASRIAIANYNTLLRSLSFTTKGNVHQTLPVTDEIADTIATLPANSPTHEPIVNLLRPAKWEGHPAGKNPRFIKSFNKLKAKLGIRAELHIHDLRRTAAEDVWEATKDIRLVQAQLGHRSPITTVRYLANKVQLQDLEPVMAKVQAMRRARAARTP